MANKRVRNYCKNINSGFAIIANIQDSLLLQKHRLRFRNHCKYVKGLAIANIPDLQSLQIKEFVIIANIQGSQSLNRKCLQIDLFFSTHFLYQLYKNLQ